MKILIIDDNKQLAQRTKEKLKRHYTIELAYSGEEGLRLLSEYTFDLVLLDLGLPDIHGLEVCAHIKRLWPEVDILVVSAESRTASKVNLLDTGATDYITKPFDTAELVSRIKAALRRKSEAPYRNLIVVGSLKINPNTRSVTREGQAITLRRLEYNILEYLCLNPGRVLTRDLIVNHAWPLHADKWTGSVSVHIKQIRDKIDKPFSAQLIKTVYGLGYMIESPSQYSSTL